MTNEKLISSIKSLLALEAKGALVPHGIGGLAQELLEKSVLALEDRAFDEAAERAAFEIEYGAVQDVYFVEYIGYCWKVIEAKERAERKQLAWYYWKLSAKRKAGGGL